MLARERAARISGLIRLLTRGFRAASAMLLGVAVLLPLSTSRASAQDEAPACPNGRISQLFIDNHSVFDLSDPDLNKRFEWAYEVANRFHVATDRDVIRREVLVEPGDCYDPEQLRDSERLLRNLNFIADVDIFGIRQADSTVHVLIDTRDEWSLHVEPRVGGGKAGLSGLRLREDNLFGTGTQVAAFYIDRFDQNVYGASYRTPQLFGSRWDAGMEAGRTPVGVLLSEVVTYPFVGEGGRWAFRQAVYRNDRNFEYRVGRNDGITRIWLPESRTSFDLGGVHRWGPASTRRTLMGAVIRGEWVSYPGEAQFADRRVRAVEAPPEIRAGLDSIASVRAMLLLGQRNVYFVRRRGLDTVRGTEDVRLGVETQVALGPSVPVASIDRDLGFGMGFFAAGELPGLGIAGANIAVEARRNYSSPASRPEWSDVFGNVSGWAYLRPNPDSRDLIVGSISAIGGWYPRVPFQLTLGSEVGLRGYPAYVDPGGRRVIASVEHRRYLGWPLPELFDLGTVVFADVGKMWAGGVPFGVDSPIRGAVGIGLRSAFPPGSKQTLRIDLGIPIASGKKASDFVISVGIGQWIGRGHAVEDGQLDRSVRLWNRRSLLALPTD